MLAITEIIQFFILPLVMITPIGMKTITATIFQNIEFKTQTFRILKINSIFDVIFMITYFIKPWIEFKNENLGNYWLVLYDIYIIIYVSRCLRTVNLILNMTVAWNQFRQNKNRNKISISNFFFYAMISIIFLFSFLLHLPNLFAYEIYSTSNRTRKIYALKATNQDLLLNLSIFQYIIDILILIFSLLLISIILYRRNKENRTTLKSIIFTKRRKETVSIIKRLNSNSISKASNFEIRSIQDTNQNCSKISNKNYKSKTQLLVIWITLAVSFDQIFKIIFECLTIFSFHKDSILFVYLSIFRYLIIIFSQLSHVFIYCKFNESFLNRFKKYCCLVK
jgi:hypothetical protein